KEERTDVGGTCERLWNGVGVDLFARQLTSGGRGSVGMQFECQMVIRGGLDLVNLNFVEIYGPRRSRSGEHQQHQGNGESRRWQPASSDAAVAAAGAPRHPANP